MTIKGQYFYGNKISDYGLENGYVDYGTLAKSINHVLNNEIIASGLFDYEMISGMPDHSDELQEIADKMEELNSQIDELTDSQSTIQDITDKLNAFTFTASAARDLDVIFQAKLDELEIRKMKLNDQIAELEEQQSDLEQDQYDIPEIFQYYITDSNGAEILEEAGEIVLYIDSLDMYIWGVTHYGTSWDYVLTNIKIEKGEN